MRLAAVILLLLVGQAWPVTSDLQGIGSPVSVGGPAGGGGVVSTTTSTTTTSTTTTPPSTVIVPAAAASDANCPSTLPTKVSSSTGVNTLNAAITCATPAVATSVVSVSFFADGTGTSGAHMKCSVYTFPGGYVAGTTSVPKVASGCDTVEWTAPNGTTSGWITLATTGACPLAASTRYQIACNQDATYFIGFNNTACTVGGVQCNQERTSQTYTTGALPDPWTANNQGNSTEMYYLTAQ